MRNADKSLLACLTVHNKTQKLTKFGILIDERETKYVFTTILNYAYSSIVTTEAYNYFYHLHLQFILFYRTDSGIKQSHNNTQ